MNELFLTYDNRGFEAAKLESKDACPLSIFQIHFLITYATHDLEKGFCKSFQIYGINGEILYNSEKKEAA